MCINAQITVGQSDDWKHKIYLVFPKGLCFYFHLPVCLFLQDNSKSFRQILMNILRVVGL